MRGWPIVLALAATLSTTPAHASVAVGPACRPQPAPVLCAIRVQAHRTNHWRHLEGLERTRLGRRVFEYPARRPYYLWVWRHKRARARALYWLVEDWYRSSGASCVHGREGSWTDPAPPYFGGFQMDLAFQRAHGRYYLERFGTADHWPAWAQKRVTRRVVLSSGWGQWPNTARACGLL